MAPDCQPSKLTGRGQGEDSDDGGLHLGGCGVEGIGGELRSSVGSVEREEADL